ncbi:hypothetical protein EON64_02310 [archaeon]|nr:MAG: hypothetical protein EON64_02310 [archaeon]
MFISSCRVNQFEPLSSSEDTSASSSLKSDPTKGTKCRLCSVPFTMFRRNHHCRLCNILCCDDCSKKRCVIDNAQVSIGVK